MQIALKPVDLLSLSFIGLLTAATVMFIPAIPHWGWLVTRYLLLALSILSLAFYTGRSNTWKPASYLYAFLPALIVPVIFDSLGDLIPYLWPRFFDDILIRIDYAMFGVHPTIWLERFIRPLLTTVLQFAYISYYFIPIVFGVTLFVKNKHREFDEAVFGILLCFYLSYVGYLLVPAVGPRFTLAHLQSHGFEASPLALSIQETLNMLENNKTDAFPSGHTAIVLITLYYAWKYKEKILFWILLPVVSALIFSTVYLRYHYVVDVLVGMLLFAITVPLAQRIFRKLGGSLSQPHGQLHRPS